MEAVNRRGPPFPFKEEAFLATIARMLAHDGLADAALVLTTGQVTIAYQGEDWRIERWGINIRLPFEQYAKLDSGKRDFIETAVRATAEKLLASDQGNGVDSASILPLVEETPSRGAFDNQGRAHSQNVAGIIFDNLKFRSQAEVNLYRALKPHDLTFGPLPVFISNGRRVEPDFLLFKDGVVLVVEVDGPMHTESPVVAHKRLEGFLHNGIRVERVAAADCATEEKAKGVAEKLVALMAKYALQR